MATAISVNWDTFALMSKFFLGMIGILLLIFLLAVLTPKLAKFVDKLLGKANPSKNMSPARVKDEDGNEYQVRDIYEGGKTEDTTEEKAETKENDEINENKNPKE